jgi:hypothetical protein
MDAPGTNELSPRLREFQEEVSRLRLGGGAVRPEGVWLGLGGLAMAAGVVVTLLAWVGTRGTESQLDFADFAAMSRFGVALTVAGAAVFVVMAIRRWFRYWLLRLIFELREQRVVPSGRDDALGGH